MILNFARHISILTTSEIELALDKQIMYKATVIGYETIVEEYTYPERIFIDRSRLIGCMAICYKSESDEGKYCDTSY